MYGIVSTLLEYNRFIVDSLQQELKYSLFVLVGSTHGCIVFASGDICDVDRKQLGHFMIQLTLV